MPNVLITELDQRASILDTDTFIVQPAAGPPAEYVTASTLANYIGTISGTVYSASTGLSLSTSNYFSIATTAVTAGAYGSGADVPVLVINAQGQVTSASVTPVSVSASQVTTGILPISQGGTSASTAAGGFDALAPTLNPGDLIYRSATGNDRLGIGAANYVLMSNGSYAVWSVNNGSVNYVNVSGGLTGLSYDGGPITSSGTITASGTLGLGYGGTSATTAITAFNTLAPTTSSGDLIYRTSTGNVRLEIGSSGQLLTASNGVPVWVTSTTSGAGTVTYVDVSGGLTGLTYNGGPITSTGIITASGTLGLGYGGTSATTAIAAFDALAPTTASGDLIYRTSTGNVSLGIGSSGQLLTASGGLPVWISPATAGTVTSVDVSGGGTGLTFDGGPVSSSGTITATGTLGLDYGGTSATTAIAAFNALAPTTASGDTIYRTSTGNVRLAIGSSGQVLTASGGIPVWISPSSSGTVNYVDVSGGGTGLSFDGGPITASGTITATGTLDVGYGGTSATTAIAAFGALAPTTTQGDLIYYFGTSNTRFAIGSTGQVLTVTSTGAGANLSWATPAVYGTVNYVDVSGGNTGLTFNGGPVTASGTITASGTLVVSAGGTGAATLTGVLKGTGTTAVVAATAGTDYVSPIVATNFTAQQTFAGATNILAAVFTNAAEVVTVATLAATGTVNYDITSQSVLYYTDVSTANFIPNFRGSSGNTLTSILATGQAVSAVWAVTMGTTAFYSTAVQVDGSTAGVTLKWQGGAAPTAGNASSVDAYNYTIIKTASESFTVLAAQTQFA